LPTSVGVPSPAEVFLHGAQAPLLIQPFAAFARSSQQLKQTEFVMAKKASNELPLAVVTGASTGIG
jgi:hypothetical protein